MYEDIGDPIEVIAYFSGGKLRPLRFRWQLNAYRISKIHSQWSVYDPRGMQHHFSVSAKTPDVFELVFDAGNFDWQLARTYVEG